MDAAGFFSVSRPDAAGERELLRAVRDLVAADRQMRQDLSRRMAMGPTDLRAIRYVIGATSAGRLTSPHDLAEHLGITTAATTAMLDRLGAAGHLERAPHPTDGRAKVVVATEHAEVEVRAQLTGTHERMRAVAAAVPASSRAAVVAFLEGLTEVMLDDGSS